MFHVARGHRGYGRLRRTKAHAVLRSSNFLRFTYF